MEEWRSKLIEEYKHNKKDLESRKAALHAEDPEHEIYTSMINEMDYVIRWLKRGYEPSIFYKGIYSKKLFEKGLEVRTHKEVIFTDNDEWLANRAIHYDVIEGLDEIEQRSLTDDEKLSIHQALARLTDKQTTCFILHEAHLIPISQIAKELGITKATVFEHIESARKKIKKLNY